MLGWFGHGMEGCIAGSLGEIGGRFQMGLKELEGLVLGGKEEEEEVRSLAEEEEENWGLSCSQGALFLRWRKRW